MIVPVGVAHVGCTALATGVDGNAVIVTVRVAVDVVHNPDRTTLYVIVAVPAAIPFTKPEVALMVATEVALEDQVPLVPVVLSVAEEPTHIF